MLASMSESGLRAETLNWSDLGMTELPTGTVSLLLADIEGSTGLWEADSDAMTASCCSTANNYPGSQR
jgi:class 3 adenylate cyclase